MLGNWKRKGKVGGTKREMWVPEEKKFIFPFTYPLSFAISSKRREKKFPHSAFFPLPNCQHRLRLVIPCTKIDKRLTIHRSDASSLTYLIKG